MPLYLSDYKPVQWSENMPITADRMNNLETGVDQNRDSIIELASRTDTMATQAWTEDFFRRETAAASQAADQGAQAWTQIVAATTPNYANLNARFDMAELLITRLREALGQLTNAETGEKTDIYSSSNTVATTFINVNNSIKAINDAIAASLGRDPNTGVPNTQLSQHMQQIDDAISELKASYASFADSTGVDESGQAIPMAIRIQQLVDVYTEVMAAHREVEEGASPDTLKLRFEAIEAALGSLTSNVNDNYVRKNDVRDNFTSSDTNLPLSAAKGKELREMIGGSFTNANTVAGAIATAQSTAQANAEGYADQHKVDKTNIYNDLDYVPAADATDDKVLDARQGKALKDLIDSMDTAYKVADTALDGRLTAAESAITTLNGSGEGSVINTVNTQIAAVVAGAPESLDTLQEIASWISNHSDSASAMNTKINENADAIAGIKSDLDTASIGIKARVTTLETSVNNETTGLAATKAIADANAAAISHVASGNNPGGLTERIIALETAPKSAAVIISFDKITYDNETGLPTLYTDSNKTTTIIPTEQSDYLLQEQITENNEIVGGKYFYWKYIGTYPNGTWNKISGDNSGEGGGNTFGVVLTSEEYNNPKYVKVINTDYYVLENDGYHHYRQIPSATIQNQLEEIEIGEVIDTTKIKRYRFARHLRQNNGEDTYYLDVYEFAYDDVAEINDEDHSQNRIAEIELPKGGGGTDISDSTCIVSYVTPQNQILTQSEFEQSGVKISFFYQAYEKSEGEYITQSATYTIKKGSRIIASGTLQSAPIQFDENGNPIAITAQYKQDNAIDLIDISKYCTANEPADFILTVVTANGIQRTRPYHVEVIELSVKSTFNSQQIFNARSNIRIPLTISSPAHDKTIYVTIDKDTENEYTFTQLHGEKASSSTTITIPGDRLNAGLHTINIYFEEIITGSTPASSNEITFDIACRDTENDNIILLSSSYRGKTITIDQYKTVKIPYYLYIPDGMSTNIVKVNSATNRTTIEEGVTGADSFLFKASQASERVNEELVPYTLTIGCSDDGESPYNPSITIYVKVTPNEYNIEPVVDNLVFDFNPTGYINNPQNEEDKFWRDENNSSIRLSEIEGENFDWDNGGWKYDDKTEASYFCVKAGSRAQINYSLFQDNMETSGSEFKCIFKATNVRDPEAVFLTSLDQETSSITNYGSDVVASDQDTEDEDTLIHNLLNVKEGHVLTYKKGKKDADKLAITIIDGTTIVLPDDADSEDQVDTSFIMTDDDFNAALLKAKDKVIKKNTTDYATTIMGYVNAYDGDEAADLKVLITQEKLLIKEQAETIQSTLSKNNEWANFRETPTYASIELDLTQLIKNLALTYDVQIITTDHFTNMIIEDDHIDEFAQKIYKTVKARVIEDNKIKEEVDSLVEISYKLDDNNNYIYQDITLVRPIEGITERSRGLEMRAHRANIHLGSGTLTYPYSEDDIIEFEYNISNPISGKKTAPILMYEDGVPSAAMLYSTGAGALRQTTKGNLIIGSDDCDIWIYRLKFYNKKLDNIEILSNFYADALNPDDMIERYENNVATYTDSSNADSITPQSVAAACPGLRVIMIEAPKLTGGKYSFIKNSKIRCIYKGEDARPEDNWVALNAYHAGQGTSSDAYGAAGRNLDIIFGFNGIDQLIAPKAKNNYRFDPSYKSILITGVDNDDDDIGVADDYIDEILNNLNDGKFESDEDYTTKEKLLAKDDFTDGKLHMYLNGTGKVNLTDTSVPNSWFNIKLNIASSENANNALLQKRYDRYLKEIYTTPAQKRGLKENLDVKNSMEFFNTVVFLKETGDEPSEFTSDKNIPVSNRQWHFYGIGNIGDSKKTDNTRINIPNDPFEFCVELSDNGLTNTGFSSGVYWTDETKTETTYNQQGSYEIKYPVTLEEWTNENNITYAALTDYDEDGGWDSSLEFRYDVSTKDGNTIADTEAEKALATARQRHNKEVFKNMYEWIVTAPISGDNSFNNHLRDWFIEESPLYWYLFTERYTMIDSRAKNTFYHYGKVYASAEEVDGETAAECTRVQACQAALTTAQQGNDETAIAAAQTAYDTAVFVWENRDCFITPDNNKYYETTINGVTKGAAEINDGYRFDLWDYDNDTALGINNNGQMVFDAGLEDIDRTANAWVYNEATSVFWRRIRNETGSKLRSVYTSRRGDCFNAENLITEFDRWQEQFPENLWRMDFERKYYRPYKDGNNMRYLRDMANGRKKYQRREFERNMCIYIDSKYVLSESYNPNDFIQFRPTEQQDPNQDKQVKITLYSPMYVNYSIGNQSEGNLTQVHERGKAGQTLSFNMMEGITSLQNIQTKIFNASCIKEIVGLENYYADDLDFTAAIKLRKIALGSDVAKIIDPVTGAISTITYRNNNTKTLELRGNPILEELDIRNCIALAQELDLSECVSLSKLYATGTPLTKVLLASGGLMKELYLPASMTALEFKNLYLLDTVQLAGYSNLVKYISQNVFKYNSQNIVFNTLSKLTELKLNDINWTINNIIDLEPLVTLQQRLGNEMYLKGTINIVGDWSEVEKNKYQAIWKDIKFNTSGGNKKIKCAVNYYNTGYISNDGEIPDELITTIFVDAEGSNSTIPDIYADVSDDELPHREPTIASTYSFGSYDENDQYIPYSGWTLNPRPTSGDPIPLSDDYNIDTNPYQPTAGIQEISLYTFFYTIKHKYKVQWKVEDKVNNTIKIIKETETDQDYGGGYSLVAPTIMDIRAANIETNKITDNGDGTFTYEVIEGWEKLPINISPTKEEAKTSIYTINAKWSQPETKTLAEFFEDTSELTAKQLAILSKLNQATINSNANIKNIIATRKFNYTMGYGGAQNGGIEFGITRTSKTGRLSTFEVNPFAPSAQGQDKGFTLVIDYQFGEINNGTSPEVLVGCYDKDSSGSSICSFALYRGYNATNGGAGTFVCFGVTPYSDDATKRKAVGDAIHRNTIVLRREKNTSTLRIYTGLNATSTTSLNTALQDNIAIELGTLNTSENAVICIGALRSDLSTNDLFSNENNNTRRALGTVYWMKYWNEDIGLGECLQLAAWPRENMTAIITAVNTATNRPKLYFTNLNCSNHSMVTNNTFTVPNANDPGPYSTGWLSSNTKAIYDTRVVKGLPVELQAIIKKPSIGYYNYVAQYSSGNTSVGLSDLRSIESYVYAPSVSSLDLNYIGVGQNEFGLESIFELTGSTDSNTSAITPYQWMRAPGGVINAKRYAGSGTSTPWVSVTPEAYWFNIRFKEKPISWSATNQMNIYIIDSSTIGSSTFYNAIGGANIQSGDIVIYRTTTSGETELYGVYMYVTTAESSTSGLLTMPNEGYWSTSADGRTYGGWIESTPYVTRSVSIGNGRQPNYAFVDKQGSLHFPNLTNDQAAAGSLSLDFAFTI